MKEGLGDDQNNYSILHSVINIFLFLWPVMPSTHEKWFSLLFLQPVSLSLLRTGRGDLQNEVATLLSCLHSVSCFNINIRFFSKGMNVEIWKWEQAQNETLLYKWFKLLLVVVEWLGVIRQLQFCFLKMLYAHNKPPSG